LQTATDTLLTSKPPLTDDPRLPVIEKLKKATPKSDDTSRHRLDLDSISTPSVVVFVSVATTSQRMII
jgi:hypothetical protein